MSLYGVDILNEADDMLEENLDEQLDIELNDILESYYSDRIDAVNEMYIIEGANKEYTDSFKKHFKDYKQLMKDGKAARKDGDINKAKKCFQDAIKAANDIKRDAEAITKDENIGSGIIGFFLGQLVNTLNWTCKLAVQLATSALPIPFGKSKIVNFEGYIYSVNKDTSKIKGLIRLIKDAKDNPATILNKYRRKIIQASEQLADFAGMAYSKCC